MFLFFNKKMHLIIDMSNMGLTSLAGYTFSSEISGLNLSNNSFVDLTTIPTSINTLIINDNPTLTSLNGTPENVTVIYARNCGLTSTQYISSNVGLADLRNNNISSLTDLSLCTNLTILLLDNNSLTSIAGIPSNIKRLSLSNNNITSLVEISTTCTELYLNNNPISSSNGIPNSLITLEISGTNIPLSTLPNCPMVVTKRGDTITDFTTLPSSICNLTIGNL